MAKKKKMPLVKNLSKAKVTGTLPSSPQKMPKNTNAENTADDEMRRLMGMNGKKSQ